MVYTKTIEILLQCLTHALFTHFNGNGYVCFYASFFPSIWFSLKMARVRRNTYENIQYELKKIYIYTDLSVFNWTNLNKKIKKQINGVCIYQTIRRHIPNGRNIKTYSRENLKYHKKLLCEFYIHYRKPRSKFS
jgi:hypothetical protein